MIYCDFEPDCTLCILHHDQQSSTLTRQGTLGSRGVVTSTQTHGPKRLSPETSSRQEAISKKKMSLPLPPILFKCHVIVSGGIHGNS